MKSTTVSSLIKGALLAAVILCAPVAADAASNRGMMDISDTDINLEVKRTVEPYKDITIKSDNGDVTVSGTVSSQQEKDRILREIRNVNGVRNVNDKLDVKNMSGTTNSSGSVGTYIDDAAITTVVKGKFLGQKGLDSLDISVETNRGVVTLNGHVDNTSQIGLAENVAMEADGVRSVVNKLTLKQ